MKTVVFYSYKGGTGRTLALANIARFAGGIGKRVIVIDLDLEAPGLTYKLLRGAQRSLSNRGLVGCLLDAIHRANIPPDLGEYLIDVELDERHWRPMTFGTKQPLPDRKPETTSNRKRHRCHAANNSKRCWSPNEERSLTG